MNYADFLDRKAQAGAPNGFEPLWVPEFLFPFQRALVEWSIRKGRSAIFADCGLGKTPMQLVWANNVVRKTNRHVLILTPLAVGAQTLTEGAKFGIECERSRDGVFTPGAKIVVTNYEKLHLFDHADFAGVVCDESSILKHFKGATQQAVTKFMREVPYRLLCTATAAPNDYVELGTSSEALGELGQVDMLGRFFKQDPKIHTMNERSKRQKMALRGQRMEHRMVVSGTGSSWRLKGHAVTPFWQWIASWARACRKPSDLGFADDGFRLPKMIERVHLIEPRTPMDGYLFAVPAFGLQEEREERRRTVEERCALAAQIVDHKRPAVVWCHLNIEGDRLAKAIPDSRQVKGADSDEEKEESFRAFAAGDIRVLVIKPKIGAFGLNWQHCSHVVTFASHSYEQFYQSVRRCWRFGQKREVTVDIIATKGEQYVLDNMMRKAEMASAMFEELVSHMNTATRIVHEFNDGLRTEIPSWVA